MSQKNPLIIPRSDHNVSRSNLSPNALKILYRLKRQGFTAYLVGGCVRDLLLGREPKDFDLVTDATPGQVKRLFRNCRLVGRRFRLAHLHFNDEIIEVATFRAEQPELIAGVDPVTAGTPSDGRTIPPPRHLKSEEGVVLRDNLFGTPEQDAMRRDFTVNALLYDIGTFSIIDYTGGVDDLRRAVLRTIGDPQERITEDPVRMLRAIRFAAMLGFSLDGATWEAIVRLSSTITRATPPRLYEEVLKLFLCGEGEKCYQLMRSSGLFRSLFPDFCDWLDRETGGFPHARIGHALAWIDRKVGDGEKVSQQLMISMIFGEYLEEMAGNLHAAGEPLHKCIDMATARLLGQLAPNILVPHRIGIQTRDVLAAQRRFCKTPGKNPHSFISRESFADAFAYFGFTNELTGGECELLSWWKRFVQENPVSTGPKDAESSLSKTGAASRKKRRRRRGHKMRAFPQTP